MLKATAQTLASPAPDWASSAWPNRVLFPAMDQDWVGLSFLHWAYDPAGVQRLLPAGVIAETFDGAAWVGVVPFLLRIRLPHGPAVPWLGVFPETNVRTYVRGPDGQSGVWFLSLEAPRRLAIFAARVSYHLPYRLAAVDLRCTAGERCYTTWRLESRQRGASSRARVTVGDAIAPADVTPLEHFLTDRWRLYAPLSHGIGTARVAHAPWRLHRASTTDLDLRLLSACGLDRPQDEPLVHACDDIHASLTRLRRCTPLPPGDSWS